jgi:hypothetical protein
LNGIRHLRGLNEYQAVELRKRYKESTRTQVFIDRCLLIADCCIALIAKSDDSVRYTFSLPADYIDPNHPQHRLNELKPHLYFSRRRDGDITEYLLESFDATLPRYQMRKRLKDYMDFLEEWNDTNEPRPVTLFACVTIADLLYVKRRVKQYIDDEDIDAQTRVTTLDKIKASGVASMIWEEV